jgi:hypothetical protein
MGWILYHTLLGPYSTIIYLLQAAGIFRGCSPKFPHKEIVNTPHNVGKEKGKESNGKLTIFGKD